MKRCAKCRHAIIAPTLPPGEDEQCEACALETVVLVVEDDPAVLRTTARYLRARGLTVVTADTVMRALALLELHRFTGVVTDFDLPDGNGSDVIKAACSANVSRRCIFTGSVLLRDTGHAAAHVVYKPGIELVAEFLES